MHVHTVLLPARAPTVISKSHRTSVSRLWLAAPPRCTASSGTSTGSATPGGATRCVPMLGPFEGFMHMCVWGLGWVGVRVCGLCACLCACLCANARVCDYAICKHARCGLESAIVRRCALVGLQCSCFLWLSCGCACGAAPIALARTQPAVAPRAQAAPCSRSHFINLTANPRA